MTSDVLEILRRATRGTVYENRLFLVGGYVRDKLLGRQTAADDFDLVLEGNALTVAALLHEKRVTDHAPVTFPTFGTAMVHVSGAQVELVTARSETYRQGSRKPVVAPGTLQTDAARRDFTINTLLENLHTGAVIDPLSRARADLAARLLRTPSSPDLIFREDPLRMLRACRFAAKLGFVVEEETLGALSTLARYCRPEHGVSYERMRDELNKTLLALGAPRGLEMMLETGLLVQFAPELAALPNVRWTHSLRALENLPLSAPLILRLATLLQDVGGAATARQVMNRLRYASGEIDAVVALVGLHGRYSEYQADWTDASVRRLIRAVGPHRQGLFVLARADRAAAGGIANPGTGDLSGLEERMERLEQANQVTTATSPLDGGAIIARLGIGPGPLVGQIKNALTDAVVAGELAPDDTAGAEAMARALLSPLRARGQSEAPGSGG